MFYTFQRINLYGIQYEAWSYKSFGLDYIYIFFMAMFFSFLLITFVWENAPYRIFKYENSNNRFEDSYEIRNKDKEIFLEDAILWRKNYTKEEFVVPEKLPSNVEILFSINDLIAFKKRILLLTDDEDTESFVRTQFLYADYGIYDAWEGLENRILLERIEDEESDEWEEYCDQINEIYEETGLEQFKIESTESDLHFSSLIERFITAYDKGTVSKLYHTNYYYDEQLDSIGELYGCYDEPYRPVYREIVDCKKISRLNERYYLEYTKRKSFIKNPILKKADLCYLEYPYFLAPNFSITSSLTIFKFYLKICVEVVICSVFFGIFLSISIFLFDKVFVIIFFRCISQIYTILWQYESEGSLSYVDFDNSTEYEDNIQILSRLQCEINLVRDISKKYKSNVFNNLYQIDYTLRKFIIENIPAGLKNYFMEERIREDNQHNIKNMSRKKINNQELGYSYKLIDLKNKVKHTIKLKNAFKHRISSQKKFI